MQTYDPTNGPTLNPVLRAFWFEPTRYKILYGGRGSSKSWDAAGMAVLLASRYQLRFMCCRQYQNKISESVYTLLKIQIERFGLQDEFEILKTTIRNLRTGAEFLFYGLYGHFDEIKSTEGIDVLWIEEAHSLTAAQWKDLDPTIRAQGSQVWIVFNPQLETDFVYQNFIINPPENASIRKINFDENPFLSDTARAVIEAARARDPDDFRHIYLGECITRTDDQILAGRWRVAEFEPGKTWDGPYYGLDFGFAQDPTAAVKAWIHDGRLYLEAEAGRTGLELDDTAEFLAGQVPGLADHVVRADCARPESISYLRRNGIPRITAASKWAGSIEDGIAHLRSYQEIVIHPRCQQLQFEAVHYRYKKDRLTGDVLPVILDKHNHYIDAVRYALSPLIKQKGGVFIGRA
jgi:phage terminase large subunit